MNYIIQTFAIFGLVVTCVVAHDKKSSNVQKLLNEFEDFFDNFVSSGTSKKSSNVGARIQQKYLSNIQSIDQNVAASQGEIYNEDADGTSDRLANTPEIIGQKVTQNVNDGITTGLADGFFGGKKNHDTQQ